MVLLLLGSLSHDGVSDVAEHEEDVLFVLELEAVHLQLKHNG